MKSNWIPRIILFISLAVAAAIPVAGHYLTPAGIEVHARMAESGGWTPESLSAVVGQPLHLRLTSDDVMHGFAIGQSSQPAVDIKPGEYTDVTLTFDHPGKYTFYCTRWCGVNHWRMRGTIEVTGSTPANPPPDPRPLYLSLGIDLDKPHPAAVVPQQKPSAFQGKALDAALLTGYSGRDYYLSHSPAETWQQLRLEPSLKSYSDQDIWNLVAVIMQANVTRQAIQEGKALYAANCAACHGEAGKGNGVMAASLGKDSIAGMPAGSSAGITGHETAKPADFSNPQTMLGASPALLQGKIIRGGMGTGMPYWGPIFTDEQTWALVAYLESLQLEMEK